MKRPYCIIDGVKHQLHIVNDVLRFPDDGRPRPDLNKMVIDYAEGRIKLDELFDYHTNSGSSFEMVRSIFGHTGGNNHIVKQGSEKTKSIRLLRAVTKKPKAEKKITFQGTVKESLQKMTDFIESDEGKAWAKEYFGKINRAKAMQESQIDRFWAKIQGGMNFSEFVLKVITKYSTEKYRMSWYSRGIEPPESLYYFLYDVAAKYGREFTDAEYQAKENTMFTAQVFVLDDWTFELIIGQGSAILIDRIKK